MERSVLIHLVETDFNYANQIKTSLAKNNFRNVTLYTNEEDCLEDIKKKPQILITAYHLKKLNGLQLIKKIRSQNPNLYSILISDDFQNDNLKVYDERFLQLVDKYIIKGMDDIEELLEAVSNNDELYN